MPFFKANVLYDNSHESNVSSALTIKIVLIKKMLKNKKNIKIL